MKTKKYAFILKSLAIILIAANSVFGQEDHSIINYQEAQVYEIGGVVVDGAKYRDDKAIIAVSGLNVGKRIKVPGQEIPTALKKLLKLQLFENIEIHLDHTVGDVAFLRISLIEHPTLSEYRISGIKKSKREEIQTILEKTVYKGSIVTQDKKELAKDKILNFYHNKGFLDAELQIREHTDSLKENAVQLEFKIKRNKRVRIETIHFVGNDQIKDSKLRRQLAHTKLKWNLFKKSKFIESDFEQDKKGIVNYYNNLGYRNAKLLSDSIWRDPKGRMHIQIEIVEGNKFYFRDISWKGNAIYDDAYLTRILGIQSGDIYNKELLDKRLRYSLDGRDISSIYLDEGYLMFSVNPIEKAIESDSIDMEIRISEGAQVTIDKVIISGNDQTNEDVIRREIRTRPGEKFSRSNIIRSQRQIMNLGYFNPERLGIQTPVNQQRGTVDIVYQLEESTSDKLEMSGGYGGSSGLIGTMGMTFNNFSIRNLLNQETWNPLPQGDGQKLSIRAQTNAKFFNSYNVSFTEPWLGGKKPTSLTLGGVYSEYDRTAADRGELSISRAFIGLGTQLKWPDDYFSYYATANFENIVLKDYEDGGFGIENGQFNNFSIKQVLTRSSINEAIFPRRGSKISLSLSLTPYYFNRKGDYFKISKEEGNKLIANENLKHGFADKLTPAKEIEFIGKAESAIRHKYLEYHKWRLDAEWYFNLIDKLVLKTEAKIGLIGYYRKDIGVGPFERFELGGDGLNNQSVGIQGRDIISSRGYEVEDFDVNNTEFGGATIFNKYTVELRYPISMNPNSTVYVSAFAQGSNAYSSWSEYNPFELKRSAGIGVRVFLPMFGLMGFDYGVGFDKSLDTKAQFPRYGQFNIILGFEPD